MSENDDRCIAWINEHFDAVTRCGPAHLCDGMSGCRRGDVRLVTPYGAVPARLADCLKPGDRIAQVNVRTSDPRHPATFMVGRRVPVGMIATA